MFALLSFLGRVYGFIETHKAVVVLAASALWFIGGYSDFKEGLKDGKKDNGYFFGGVGIVIATGYCLFALVSANWLDSLLAAGVATLEAWHLKRRWTEMS